MDVSKERLLNNGGRPLIFAKDSKLPRYLCERNEFTSNGHSTSTRMRPVDPTLDVDHTSPSAILSCHCMKTKMQHHSALLGNRFVAFSKPHPKR